MKVTNGFLSNAGAALFIGALLLASVPAKGDIILSVESVTGAPGSSGTFDVLLENTGAPQDIAGFSFELTTTDTNITFGDVTTSTTTDPYIFAADSLFGPDIGTGTAQTVLASDIATDNGVDVGTGETLGLGSVSYTIAAGASNDEIAEVEFAASPLTFLSDSSGASVSFTPQSGTITVQTTATVPEPSGVFEFFVLLALCVWLLRTRIRRPV